VALVPGLAAREVAVGALGTVYAMSAAGQDVAGALQPILARGWSVATGLSLLAGMCSPRSACRRWQWSGARPTPGGILP